MLKISRPLSLEEAAQEKTEATLDSGWKRTKLTGLPSAGGGRAGKVERRWKDIP